MVLLVAFVGFVCGYFGCLVIAFVCSGFVCDLLLVVVDVWC